MNSKQLKEILLWCVSINYAILLIWFGVFIFAHDLLFLFHTRWFRLSPEMFDAVHYAGIAIYKIGILLLNLTPLIALCISSRDK